ncbi:ubiquitin carboxyl-terminal hydrolase 36-like [Mizuhopecten yessoensis]|uniref:Ubiquitin carboxyl-terminal hydrolase 36 n=1 Tax=Mizuhopecten yessoensis TaxID=6573 RepID=A0A210QGI9_MIZYE|nr:ubiquitin carboxyl-terminal hydrolase 36-like [Mizuhopecten yessoensis]OWF47819.1 Ubiquitin carboxyl-terminal hydrolase 36 [Mizuhopecten yessoensis]
MPASSSENIGQIEESLKSSLAGEESLDSQLLSSSKQVLLHKIDFKPAEKPYSLQVDSLRAKYIPLNQFKKYSTEQNGSNKQKEGSRMNGEGDGDSLPTPKVVLYPEEKVQLEWRKMQKIGAGLVNMGNTCFLNSTLQCLTYTAPLVNFCLSNEHSTTCKQAGFCMMCELQRHVKRCYENSGNAIKPQSVLQKLRMIAKHMHWGRQEDAHEFLRYVVDAMQRSCLNGHNKLDKFSKETTVVNQIFGGFLRSQVQCMRCKEMSNTYDPFLDVSLDIKAVQTLEKALEKYVHPETLDNDNAYMCTKCKQKVPAHKRFSIHKAPNILTISLKRFDYNRLMGKVSRHIQFPEKLNLRPYMSYRQGEKVMYQLYAVLVHSGFSCNSGHYYCYVKSPSQIWYCMNDSMVQQVSATRVLSCEAYLLFYIKSKPSLMSSKSIPRPLNNKTPVIGPSLPPNHTINNKKFRVNGVISGPSNDLGSSVARKHHSSSSLSSSTQVHKSTSEPSLSTPLPDKRDRVAFGIKPQTYVKQQSATEDKPRIVMQIKNGKVTTFEKSPNGKSKIVKDSDQVKSLLVPYGDDSESDSENTNSATKGKKTETKSSSVKKEDKKFGLPLFSQKNIRRHLDDSAVVFDKKLNATTSVPGNANLLDTKGHGGEDSKNHRLDGLNLMVSPSKDLTLQFSDKSAFSPGKRILGDNPSISCVTNLVPAGSSKVNSTTNWQVFNQDSAPSPSVGSSSSRDSVNSTTEWTVMGNKDMTVYPKVPERQFPGWKVQGNEKVWEEGNNKSSLSSPDTRRASEECAEGLRTVCDKSDDKCTTETQSNSSSDMVSSKSSTMNQISEAMDDKSVDISDKQSLLSESLSVCSDGKQSIQKKHKKHKKHKKEHKDFKYQELVHDSDSSGRVKKHKKKKHKLKKELKSTDHGIDKKRFINGEKEEEEKGPHKKSESESEDSEEFVWVEKTKDSFKGPCGDDKTSENKVPVQSWDHHIKDGYKRPNNGPSGDAKSGQYWDGTKKARVADELEKSSNHVYGSSVVSWNGGKSSLDLEADRERERKRAWSDAYDEEFDRGKVKKVKKNYADFNFLPNNNFQKMQDDRNQDRNRWKGSHEGSSHYNNGYNNGTNGSHHKSSNGPHFHSYHSEHRHRDNNRSYFQHTGHSSSAKYHKH